MVSPVHSRLLNEQCSSLTFPLTELLTRKKNFKLTPVAQEAFEKLKTSLISVPLLVHPNYEKPFILQYDASTYGIGAVLAQKDDKGVERAIAYISQNLNKVQRNYSITKL